MVYIKYRRRCIGKEPDIAQSTYFIRTTSPDLTTGTETAAAAAVTADPVVGVESV